MAEVMFRYEVPFGHRLMNHEGKCRFPHGHNYLFEVVVRGPVEPETGMIIDFSKLKDIVRNFFEKFDHAFVLFEEDPMVNVFRQNGQIVSAKTFNTKVVVLNEHPTA